MGLPMKDQAQRTEFEQNALIEHLRGKSRIELDAIREQLAASRTLREFAFKLEPFSTNRFLTDQLIMLFTEHS